MNSAINDILENELSILEVKGNLRHIPGGKLDDVTDFTSNDYLGFGTDKRLREQFYSSHNVTELPLTSSASRLLAANQQAYSSLENTIESSYRDYSACRAKDSKRDKKVLIFNSGYHANAGIIAALAGRDDLIIADRYVHASIIDGIVLSRANFVRFRHNDFNHLESLLERHYKTATGSQKVIVAVESVYSMDGDRSDLRWLAEIKRKYPSIILYVDEAHAIGVCGPSGLGEATGQNMLESVDILVGTFGKALASMGAFALVSDTMRRYLVNRSRPLIFSTAMPPLQTAWTEYVWKHSLGANSAREALADRAFALSLIIPGGEPSHIRPLIIGDATEAVAMSQRLAEQGFNVLPIRTPTVPAGTERLRFSLNSAIPNAEITRLKDVLTPMLNR